MEYYIYDVPVFVTAPLEEGIDLPGFCQEVEDILPHRLLHNLDVVYVGEFKGEQGDRTAMYSNGAIYISVSEPTNFDMLESFVHEVAHSLESKYGMFIYTDNLINEFKGKRERLSHLLSAEGFHINPVLYGFTEYNEKFDDFLANEVGYPTLLSLTMGLFVSPYGATSVQEYFANGFEKYFLDNPRTVRDISPILYRKIEEIINDDEA
ncbi:hypothetical protein HOH51_04035 [bacterium]|jgi:hypothetical protein|nr:hypothetical protein [bacterium]